MGIIGLKLEPKPLELDPLLSRVLETPGPRHYYYTLRWIFGFFGYFFPFLTSCCSPPSVCVWVRVPEYVCV